MVRLRLEVDGGWGTGGPADGGLAGSSLRVLQHCGGSTPHSGDQVRRFSKFTNGEVSGTVIVSLRGSDYPMPRDVGLGPYPYG